MIDELERTGAGIPNFFAGIGYLVDPVDRIPV